LRKPFCRPRRRARWPAAGSKVEDIPTRAHEHPRRLGNLRQARKPGPTIMVIGDSFTAGYFPAMLLPHVWPFS
jgi:hypothetical protein